MEFNDISLLPKLRSREGGLRTGGVTTSFGATFWDGVDDCFLDGGGAVVLAFVVVCLFSLRFSVFLVERRWLELLNFFGRLLLLDREALASLLLELLFFLQVRAILSFDVHIRLLLMFHLMFQHPVRACKVVRVARVKAAIVKRRSRWSLQT